ncbi:MAG: hypothetical protein RLZZ502_359 [Pseudomonadota bacterium]|jgi:hypothetical protein
MSGAHFHVHGPHDHELEHAAKGGHGDHGGHGEGDNSAGKIAVMTAILATVGALFSYQAGVTQNDSMLHKNNAAIKKTEASNQWNYYQAKSNKQNLAELSLEIVNTPERKDFYKNEIDRYKKEKKEIQGEAEKLEKASKDADKKSDESMHKHHQWAQAMTAIQVSIALAAITLLTKKKWMEYACWAVAAIGLGLGVMALISH